MFSLKSLKSKGREEKEKLSKRKSTFGICLISRSTPFREELGSGFLVENLVVREGNPPLHYLVTSNKVIKDFGERMKNYVLQFRESVKSPKKFIEIPLHEIAASLQPYKPHGDTSGMIFICLNSESKKFQKVLKGRPFSVLEEDSQNEENLFYVFVDIFSPDFVKGLRIIHIGLGECVVEESGGSYMTLEALLNNPGHRPLGGAILKEVQGEFRCAGMLDFTDGETRTPSPVFFSSIFPRKDERGARGGEHQPPVESEAERGESPSVEQVEGGEEQTPREQVEEGEEQPQGGQVGGGEEQPQEEQVEGGEEQPQGGQVGGGEEQPQRGQVGGGEEQIQGEQVEGDEEQTPGERAEGGEVPTGRGIDGGGERFYLKKSEHKWKCQIRPGRGKEINDFEILWNNNETKFEVNLKDSEQQAGQDVNDQQNRNAQQEPFFSGSGENSPSFPPGRSLGSVFGNNRSEGHGAGNRTNNSEKRRSHSVNKDNNDCVTVTSSYSVGTRKEDTVKHPADQCTSAEVSLCKSTAPFSEFTEEQINYYKLCYVVTDVLPEGLREIFKREWDSRYGVTLGEWKDEPNNGMDLRKQESDRNQRRHIRLWETLKNGRRAEWDSSMLFHAILYSDSFPSLHPTVKSNLNDLRCVRNEFAHLPQAKISSKDFESVILTVKNAFQELGLREPKIPEIGPMEECRDMHKEFVDIKKRFEEWEMKYQKERKLIFDNEREKRGTIDP